MPGYGASTARHRIWLTDYNGSQDWVDIKAGRSSAAETRVTFAGFKITGVTADLKPIVQVTDDPLLKMRAALFAEHIVEWTLRENEDDPEPMPLTWKTFTETLDGDAAAWLDKTITAYYEQRKLTPEQVQDLSGKSSAPLKV